MVLFVSAAQLQKSKTAAPKKRRRTAKHKDNKSTARASARKRRMEDHAEDARKLGLKGDQKELFINKRCLTEERRRSTVSARLLEDVLAAKKSEQQKCSICTVVGSMVLNVSNDNCSNDIVICYSCFAIRIVNDSTCGFHVRLLPFVQRVSHDDVSLC